MSQNACNFCGRYMSDPTGNACALCRVEATSVPGSVTYRIFPTPAVERTEHPTTPPASITVQALPVDSVTRKNLPMVRGCLDYFPAALAAVAELSKKGNDKHNPGEPMHHARGKSMDHADCIVRHLVDRGTVDPDDGIRHSAKVAWRALALLQEELEGAGAPMARGAKP